MANLDTLRGYSQNRYGEVRQYATTEYISQSQALGYQMLSEPMWNRGESAVVVPAFSSFPSLCPSDLFFLSLKAPPRSVTGPGRVGDVTIVLCWDALGNVIRSSPYTFQATTSCFPLLFLT